MNNTLGRARPCAEDRSRLQGAKALGLPKNFPHALLRAVALLTASGSALPGHLELGQSDRLVFAAIVRCASVRDPRRSIWAHKATLAAAAGVSESTVYRALRRLVAGKLIARQEQERRNLTGRLSVARVRLTDAALELLGLGREAREADAPTVTAPSPVSTPSISMTDGPIRGVNLLSEDPQDQSPRQSGAPAVGDDALCAAEPQEKAVHPKGPRVPTWDGVGMPVPCPSRTVELPSQVGTPPDAPAPNCHSEARSRAFGCRPGRAISGAMCEEGGSHAPFPLADASTHRAVGAPAVPTWDSRDKSRAPCRSGSVPADLRWLESIGMRRSMIWRLMAAYSRRGARLGHALCALKPRLFGLPVPRVFAYLWSMHARELDFAALARAADSEREQVKATRAETRLEASVLGALRRAGARFQVLATGAIWTSDGAVARADHSPGVLPINGRLAVAVREGRVAVL